MARETWVRRRRTHQVLTVVPRRRAGGARQVESGGEEGPAGETAAAQQPKLRPDTGKLAQVTPGE